MDHGQIKIFDIHLITFGGEPQIDKYTQSKVVPYGFLLFLISPENTTFCGKSLIGVEELDEVDGGDTKQEEYQNYILIT